MLSEHQTKLSSFTTVILKLECVSASLEVLMKNAEA